MELNILKKNHGLVSVIIVIFYSVGIAGLSIEFSREIFRQLVPLSLLGSAVLMLLMDESGSIRLWWILIFIYFSSFLVEMAGVNTGLVFGEYEYGQTLGFKILGTPLIIGINWIILVYAIWQSIGSLKIHGILKVIIASFSMVTYDFALEPIAIILDMWSWGMGDIPVQNYIAWFVISLVFFTILELARVRIRNRISLVLLLTQFFFFVILNFILK